MEITIKIYDKIIIWHIIREKFKGILPIWKHRNQNKDYEISQKFQQTINVSYNIITVNL